MTAIDLWPVVLVFVIAVGLGLVASAGEDPTAGRRVIGWGGDHAQHAD